MKIIAAIRDIVVLILFVISIMSVPCPASDLTVSAEELTYITEQYPPYNYKEDGKLQGISVDLLERMWKKMGVNLNRSAVEFLPWTEGYRRTISENNTVLFSTLRLPEREQMFKWVGPAVSGRDALLVKRDRNISISGLEDLKNYRIGGIWDDVAVLRLINGGQNEDELILENTSAPIIEMLKNGSIDAWAYNDLAGIQLIQESGENLSDYKIAYVLGQSDAYFAFNKNTSDSIVQSFQRALDDIKNDKDPEGVFILLQIQADLQGSLNDIDSDLARAAQSLSITGLQGNAAKDVLSTLLQDENLSGAGIFDNDGRIIISKGIGSENAEGINISGQEHVASLLQTKTPVFSKQMMLVEGYNGSILAYPVFSTNGEFIGGVSVILMPDKLVNAVVAPKLRFDASSRSNITDYSLWMMHLDGLIAYDRDESQIGRNLFDDPLYAPYPNLLSLGEKMITARSGHSYYSFQVTEGNKRIVTKDAYWTTVGLHGREWRLVLTKIMK